MGRYMVCSGPRRERQAADTLMKYLMATAAIATARIWSAPPPTRLAAQTGTAATAIPRMADGHPDLSGVWWGGADVGGRRAAPAGGGGGRGGAGGRGPAQPAPTFASLYQPSAQAKAKTLSDK